jgi:hypothetical protein
MLIAGVGIFIFFVEIDKIGIRNRKTKAGRYISSPSESIFEPEPGFP